MTGRCQPLPTLLLLLLLALLATLPALSCGSHRPTRDAIPGAEPGYPASAAAGPRKLALLVGISQYARADTQEPKWWNLSCQGDVDELKKVLVERFDFTERDILTLTNEQVTRQGIVEAFERHLIAQARPGDVAVFHFSGHGQQIPDDNGDELDGLDESLVPFDYISAKAENGAKTNLRDDQLGALLNKLRQKMQGPDGRVQGNITVLLDCCYSGTATRGDPPVGRLTERGRGWIEALDGPRPKPASAGKEDGAGGVLDGGMAVVQGYVVLSAARHDQTAKEITDEEGRGMGAFTYHLVRALRQATPQTTYRTLFERVSVEVAAMRAQNPQLEGEMDQLLFAGTARPVSPYLVVQQVKDGVVLLPVGIVQGATAGSRFDLFAAGSDIEGKTNRLAEVEIAEVRETSSWASLTTNYLGKVKPESLMAARAVETLHHYRESRLKVFLKESGPWANRIKELNVLTTEGVNGTKELSTDYFYNFRRPCSGGWCNSIRRGIRPDEDRPRQVPAS